MIFRNRYTSEVFDLKPTSQTFLRFCRISVTSSLPELLNGHVTLEVECLDRLYLNGSQRSEGWLCQLHRSVSDRRWVGELHARAVAQTHHLTGGAGADNGEVPRCREGHGRTAKIPVNKKHAKRARKPRVCWKPYSLNHGRPAEQGSTSRWTEAI